MRKSNFEKLNGQCVNINVIQTCKSLLRISVEATLHVIYSTDDTVMRYKYVQT
jgi:hypothetical protein